LIFEKLINYDNIRLIKETDINQSQISLLPWIGNFTQSFLHSRKIKRIVTRKLQVTIL